MLPGHVTKKLKDIYNYSCSSLKESLIMGCYDDIKTNSKPIINRLPFVASLFIDKKVVSLVILNQNYSRILTVGEETRLSNSNYYIRTLEEVSKSL